MKILITYVEAGNGHKVASQAIADALKSMHLDEKYEIIEKNLYEENPRLKKYQDFLIKEVKRASLDPMHSNAQLISMHLIGAKNTLKFVNGVIYKKQRDMYIDELKKIKPDIIIDTHYFGAYCAVTYRNKYDKNCKTVIYDPDNNVHGWWDVRTDKLIVNNHLAYEEALSRGFKPGQVEEVFFLTRKNIIETNESKEYYREKLGIPNDRFVVKLADGIYGEAKMESFIDELVKSDKPMSIIAIAGKNEKLYNKLMEMKNTLPENIKLFPYPFVKNINEMIAASDLFITKAGPNAVLDSVFLNVPIVINYYANKIEATTKKIFVDRAKCGLYIGDKKDCRAFVEECIDNPEILKPYIENTKQFDRNKSGSLQSAQIIAKMAEEIENKKLKLLIVTETYFPVTGGVQNVVDKSAINLSKYCDVTVATTKKNGYKYQERPFKLLLCKGFYNKITNDGIPFIYLDRKFRKAVKSGNFDVIHCHNAGLLYNYMLKIGKRYHIPVISTIHNTIYEDTLQLLKSKPLARAITKSFTKRINKSDAVWKISEWSFNFLKPFGVRQDCEMMRNCVDLVPKENLESEASKFLREKYNLGNKTILLNLGRVVKLKNVDWLIPTAQKLVENKKDFVIIVVGDGEYFKEFKSKIEKLNLESYFIFTGVIRDRDLISKYYAGCDVLLFPSNTREVSPLIPVEAAAFKKATITIKGSPAGENITDLQNGYLCDNNDISFAEKTLYYVNNKEGSKEIGENAFKTIYRCYSDDKMIFELMDHYKKDIQDYKEKRLKK